MHGTDDQDPRRYDDIIDLPRHVSARHRPMAMQDRAAQFSPFAALTGYGDAIAETARLTDARAVLDEETQALLNRRVAVLCREQSSRPLVRLVCFESDPAKEGGAYVTVEGRVRRVDLESGLLCLTDGSQIPLADICRIEGEVFDGAFSG